jgi:beta-1,4-mannosyltransferase
MSSPFAPVHVAAKPISSRVRKNLETTYSGDDRLRSIIRFIHDDEIQICINADDVVALPYRDILISGSALLFMSFGRPLIIPRLRCVTELLDDRGAFLYDSRDPGALDADGLAEAYDWQKYAGVTGRVHRECTGTGVR